MNPQEKEQPVPIHKPDQRPDRDFDETQKLIFVYFKMTYDNGEIYESRRFLVNRKTNIMLFNAIVRTKIKLSSTEGLFLFVNNNKLLQNGTLGQIYDIYKNQKRELHIMGKVSQKFGGPLSYYECRNQQYFCGERFCQSN